MPKIFSLIIALSVLAACSQGLQFKIRFNDATGLERGAAVAMNDQTVAQVTDITLAPDHAYLVSVSVEQNQQSAATDDSSFFVADDPNQPGKKRIEIVQTRTGGKSIADGATVQGSSPSPLGTFPFGALLKEFGKAMKEFSGQVEYYRKEFEKLPDSDEGRQLQREWKQVLEVLMRAQSAAEGSVRKDLIPKLQQELDALRKKLDDIKPVPKGQGKPLDT